MVRSTLRRNNIECFMEGSVAYAVMVPQKQVKQARRALLDDPQLRPLVTVLDENGRVPDSAEK
jgi:hypothetical protein